MAAYLSRGRRIHLPCVGSLEQGSIWTPHCDLFIHDDPRVVYHDLEDLAAGGLTADRLLLRGGHCDGAETLEGPAGPARDPARSGARRCRLPAGAAPCLQQ